MNNFKCSLCPFAVNSDNGWRKHMQNIHGVEKPYKCEICEKSFSEKAYLIAHEQIHINKDRRKCPQCEKAYKNRSGVWRHVRIHHEGKLPLVSCPKCQKMLHKDGLSRHLRLHKEKEMNQGNQCEICGKVLASLQSYHSHKKLEHSISKTVPCSTCGRILASQINLKLHQKIYHSPTKRKRIPCHLCGRPILAARYNEHVGPCSGRKGFHCYFCGNDFGRMRVLGDHIVACHTKEKPYPCKKCHFRSGWMSHLRIHQKYNHSSTRNDTYPCYFCGKLFPRKEYVTAHIKCVHIKEKPFKCGYCSKRFHSSSALTGHMKIGGRSEKDKVKHGVKLSDGKVECPKCLTVVTKIALVRHLKIHDPNRQKYECPVCSVILLHKDYAKNHMKTHDTNRERYRCEECGKTYSSRGNLRHHKVRKHQRRDRATCPQCGVDIYLDCFNQHIRDKHRPPGYACYFCRRPFRILGNLRQHMLTQHVKEQHFKCDLQM